MITGHGGNIYELANRLGCLPSEIIDMSSNVNPLGPFPELVDHLKNTMGCISFLPEVDAGSMITDFAAGCHIPSDQVIAGNGTTQLIYTIPGVLETRRALIIGPTYADYADACVLFGAQYDYFITEESTGFFPDMDKITKTVKNYDTVFICNPNNPTGILIPLSKIKRLCESYPNVFFIVDESYLYFVNNYDKNSMIHSNLPNVLLLNSMSKIFTIPGLRIGFLISSPQIIEKFKSAIPPWSVNSIAQIAVRYLMNDMEKVENFIQKSANFIKTERSGIQKRLNKSSGIHLFPGTTSFILTKLSSGLTADDVCARLAQNRILIRNCANFAGLSEKFIRISLKTHEINRILADKLLLIIDGKQ